MGAALEKIEWGSLWVGCCALLVLVLFQRFPVVQRFPEVPWVLPRVVLQGWALAERALLGQSRQRWGRAPFQAEHGGLRERV